MIRKRSLARQIVLQASTLPRQILRMALKSANLHSTTKSSIPESTAQLGRNKRLDLQRVAQIQVFRSGKLPQHHSKSWLRLRYSKHQRSLRERKHQRRHRHHYRRLFLRADHWRLMIHQQLHLIEHLERVLARAADGAAPL